MSNVPTTKYKQGSGCGGKPHPVEQCAICNRRCKMVPWTTPWLGGDGYPGIRNMGTLAVIHRPSWNRQSYMGSAFGVLFIALIAFGLKKNAGYSTGAIIALIGIAGSILAYNSPLFPRRVIFLDPEQGLFIDSNRALLFRPKEITFRFSEMSFIGLEAFRQRHWRQRFWHFWEDGVLQSESPKMNVWLEMLDGRIYSFGGGEPHEVRSLAHGLHKVTGVPLRELDPTLCPTQDLWIEDSAGGGGS